MSKKSKMGRFHSYRDGFALGARGGMPPRVAARRPFDDAEWQRGFSDGHAAYAAAMQACAVRLGTLATFDGGAFVREHKRQERAAALVDRVLRFLGIK